jgi:hypothetical protein
MIKKCREKSTICKYATYNGTNAEECVSLNKCVFNATDDGKLQCVYAGGGLSDVDVGSYVVVGRGYGVFEEKEFHERFEDVVND